MKETVNDKDGWKVPLGIAFIIVLFYALTLREGHNWGGDFAMYIIHAINIVEGLPYDQSGHIINRERLLIGPKAYPPVFPILLVPVYILFGLNITAMKGVVIAAFGALTVITYRIISQNLSKGTSIIATLVLGLSPNFWHYKDDVMSDIPFTVIAFLALLAIGRGYPREEAGYIGGYRGTQGEDGGSATTPPPSLLIILLIYLAVGTRSVGVVLLPTLLIFELIRRRTLSAPTLLIVAGVCLLIYLQKVIFFTEGAYKDVIGLSNFTLPVLIKLLYGYISSFEYIWSSDPGATAGKYFTIPALMLAVTGYVRKVRRDLTPFEIFAPLYLIAITAYSSLSTHLASVRFLIPLMPLLIFYIFYAIESVRSKKVRASLLAVVTLSMALLFARAYSIERHGPYTSGPYTEDSLKLFSHIRENTEKEDIIIFRKPRPLSLYTGRRASVYSVKKDYREIITYMEGIGAEYIIRSPRIDNPYMEEFYRIFEPLLMEVYSNDTHRLYRLSPPNTPHLPTGN